MARDRQLNVRLTAATLLCLETLRGPRQSQADLITALLVTECERRYHDCAQSGDEERAGFYANALWHFDHEPGSVIPPGPRPSPPRHGQFWDQWSGPEEVELAAALAAAWQATGRRLSLAGFLKGAVLSELRALAAGTGDLPAEHPASRRCAKALHAYRALFTAQPATEPTGT